jgi:hypothetical protein
MSRIDNRIEDYRSRLHPEDRDRFDEQYDDAHDELDEDAIYDELDTTYEREEEHLEIVTAIASAFHHKPIADGYETGYRFAFTEPLEEQNSVEVGEEEVKNGDVILAKEDGGSAKICIVECKSGSSAGRDWAKKLEQIEKVVNTDKYREVLRNQLGVDEIVFEQYVVCGKLIQIVSMDYDRIDDDLDIPPNYAFWGYDLGDQQIVQVHGNIRDQRLAGEVNDSMDAGKVENPIEFTFSDHPLTQLKALAERLINTKRKEEDSHPFEFSRTEFYDAFDDELQVGFTGDVRDKLVEQRVDSLLETGCDVDFFTSEPDRLNSSRDYRILFQGQSIKAAKQAAEDKYLAHQSEVKRKERAFEDIKSGFQPQQTRLGEWGWENSEKDDE